MEHIYMEELAPTMPSPERKVIIAEVAVIWPYSNSKQWCAYLFRELIHSLRRGQVRVQFRGAGAKAIADANIKTGDIVNLSLEGAKWEEESEDSKNQYGKSAGWELVYEDRLIAEITRKDQAPLGINVEIPTIVQSPAQSVAPPVEHETVTSLPNTTLDSRLSTITRGSSQMEWSSPAFLKRSSPSAENPFADSPGFDIFAEDGPARKKQKTISWAGVRQWKVIEGSTSTGSDDTEPEGQQTSSPVHVFEHPVTKSMIEVQHSPSARELVDVHMTKPADLDSSDDHSLTELAVSQYGYLPTGVAVEEESGVFEPTELGGDFQSSASDSDAADQSDIHPGSYLPESDNEYADLIQAQLDEEQDDLQPQIETMDHSDVINLEESSQDYSDEAEYMNEDQGDQESIAEESDLPSYKSDSLGEPEHTIVPIDADESGLLSPESDSASVLEDYIEAEEAEIADTGSESEVYEYQRHKDSENDSELGFDEDDMDAGTEGDSDVELYEEDSTQQEDTPPQPVEVIVLSDSEDDNEDVEEAEEAATDSMSAPSSLNLQTQFESGIQHSGFLQTPTLFVGHPITPTLRAIPSPSLPIPSPFPDERELIESKQEDAAMLVTEHASPITGQVLLAGQVSYGTDGHRISREQSMFSIISREQSAASLNSREPSLVNEVHSYDTTQADEIAITGSHTQPSIEVNTNERIDPADEFSSPYAAQVEASQVNNPVVADEEGIMDPVVEMLAESEDSQFEGTVVDIIPTAFEHPEDSSDDTEPSVNLLAEQQLLDELENSFVNIATDASEPEGAVEGVDPLNPDQLGQVKNDGSQSEPLPTDTITPTGSAIDVITRNRSGHGQNMSQLIPIAAAPTTQRTTRQAIKEQVRGLTTSISHYSSLTCLAGYLNTPVSTVDIIAVVTSATEEPVQAASGPRDYSTTLRIADPDSMPLGTSNTWVADGAQVQVQIFRPRRRALPNAEVGDVVLLRGFKVKSRKGKLGLVSGDESAWCVWRFVASGIDEPNGEESPQEQSGRRKRSKKANDYKIPGLDELINIEIMTGPPAQLGDEERTYAGELRTWWKQVSIDGGDSVEDDDDNGPSSPSLSYDANLSSGVEQD